MSNQQSYGTETRESTAGAMGTTSGQAAGGGGQSSSSSLNWGSARSDYGDNAYGGSLDEEGLGGAGYDDFDEGRGGQQSSGASTLSGARSSGRTKGRGGYKLSANAGSTGLTLLAGMVIGATLMYIFDPEQGGRRRSMLREKFMGLSSDATDMLGKTTRDLRDRAQSVVATTTKAIGLGGQDEAGAAASGGAQGNSAGASNEGARAAGA